MVNVLDLGWLLEGLRGLGKGAATTVMLLVVAAFFGSIFSVLGAVCRRSRYLALRRAIAVYVEFLRNTPFLVQLFVIYFGLPSIGIKLDPIPAAILAMTINLAAYGTEIVGAGLDAVPQGQKEAARSLGLKPRIVFLKVVLPQALKIIFPALASQWVITMLETAVVSQISVTELTYEADLLQSKTFRTFETYLFVTFVYLGMCIALRGILNAVGRRMLRGSV